MPLSVPAVSSQPQAAMVPLSAPAVRSQPRLGMVPLTAPAAASQHGQVTVPPPALPLAEQEAAVALDTLLDELPELEGWIGECLRAQRQRDGAEELQDMLAAQ